MILEPVPGAEVKKAVKEASDLNAQIDRAIEQFDANPSYDGAVAIQRLQRKRAKLWGTLPRNKPEEVK